MNETKIHHDRKAMSVYTLTTAYHKLTHLDAAIGAVPNLPPVKAKQLVKMQKQVAKWASALAKQIDNLIDGE